MIIDIDFEQKKNLIAFQGLETKNEEGIYNFRISIPITTGKTIIEPSPLVNDESMKNDINNIFNDNPNKFDFEEANNEDIYFINRFLLSEKKKENSSSTLENSLTLKKRKLIKSKRKKEHSKFEKDNMMKKINIHFISFIVKYVNYNIKKLLSKNHPIFTNLSYNFKKKINNSNFYELKKMTIGEVLKNEGSNKNKRNGIYLKDDNEKIFNLVYNTELKELLDINYIKFFRQIYARTNEENDDEIFKKYNYPKNILFFDDFLKSEAKKDKINGESYKERLKYISKSLFINEGYPFFTTKNLCKNKHKK